MKKSNRKLNRLRKMRAVNLMLFGCFLLMLSPLGTLSTAFAEGNETGVSKVSATAENELGSVSKVEQTEDGAHVYYTTGEEMKVSFLKDNMLRLHMDPEKEFQEYPTPNSEDHVTKIIAKEAEEFKEENPNINIEINESDNIHTVSTDALELSINNDNGKMSLYDKTRDKVLWEEAEPLKYENNQTVQTMATNDDEYFYGGGQQNGYYSHKNESINIAIGGGWDAGAASSPVPFYLSTEGYGVMRNTFKPGVYDFSKEATFTHNENKFDAYYFVGDTIPNVINEYTELTGKPALMPEYSFYVGHADCFNGVHNGHNESRTLMEDALNYVNAYVDNDMPLGWFLPNDGYSCGYGDIDNLKAFADAAAEKNVVAGLWTQSDLYPNPDLPVDSPLYRDIEKEVGAGTYAIKTDVAWVGQGYSMALHAQRQSAEGIENYSKGTFPEYGARPFIVSLDGWAGSQRYSHLWTGDQYGGNWEYIRMHIPTFIGAGLSGSPSVGSDMDGIFGGDAIIQTRDHQWKAFTPIQLDMGGWAGKEHEKNAWNYGEPYASINRMYLKLKAEMLPYNYSIAEESTSTAMPMVRGMMLEYPDDPYTYGTETQYQYMWGPNLLIAPIYKESDHNAGVRNGIYLPDENQTWIDYFTGEQYKGGAVINNFDAPLWKTPVLVKAGAIIPMAPENNSVLELDGSENRIFEVYPSGKSDFTMYEDDGRTQAYKDDKNMKTNITSEATEEKAVITVGKAVGQGYKGFVADRGTEFVVNTYKAPESVSATINDEEVTLTEVNTMAEFEETDNAYFYDEAPELNKHATEGSDFAEQEIITNPKIYVKVEKANVQANVVTLTVDGFSNEANPELGEGDIPATPETLIADEESITDNKIVVEWDEVSGDNVQYDLNIDGVIYKNVYVEKADDTNPYYAHEELKSDREYTYQVRATNAAGESEWSDAITAKTDLNRYRNVPENMTGTANSEQPGEDAKNAVDGDDNTIWHTNWNSGQELPHTYEIDMKLAYNLDKFEYLPRIGAANGTILKYDLDVSLDGKVYKNIVKDGEFERNDDLETIDFDNATYARYVKLTITDSVGGFASAREFRPYKKDKTEGWIVGQNIPNQDAEGLTEADLTALDSYMGVDTTDTAWEQVSKMDINYDGVIDAYDLMYVASQLGDEPLTPTGDAIKGSLTVTSDKQEIEAGEEFTVTISGEDLQDINAVGVELGLDETKYELVKDGVKTTEATEHMVNKSIKNDKGKNARLLIALSNKGKDTLLTGDLDIATVTLKARQDITFDMDVRRPMLVNTAFDTLTELVNKPTEPEEPEVPEEPEDTRILTSEDVTATGDVDKVQGGADGFASLTDGDKSEESLLELKWNLVGDEGISLPLDVNFEFTEPEAIESFEVFNRPQNSNGKIKKLSAIAIDEAGNEYDLGTKEVAKDAETVVFSFADLEPIEKVATFQSTANADADTKFTNVIITFEESHSGELMLSVAEVEFTAKVEGQEEPVDTAALEAKIAEAEKVDTEGFTAESVATFNEQLTAAQEVLENTAATQVEIDAAVVSLQDAIDGLEEEVVVDRALLESKIAEAEKVDTKEFTAESVATFNEQLTAAQEVLGNATATQAEIDTALNSLQAAIDGLEEAVDEVVEKAALEQAITEAEELVTTGYTAESVAAFKEQLTAAQEVLVNTEATQAEVDTAIRSLQASIDGLVKVVVDEEVEKDRLAQAIKDAEGKDEEAYTAESFAALQVELSTAKKVFADENATQGEVKAALDALGLAINGLVEVSPDGTEKVDRSALSDVIKQAEKVNVSDYTDASVKALQGQLAIAKETLSDKAATQTEIDSVVKELTKALENIVLKEKAPVIDNNGEQGDKGNQGGNKVPETATNMYNGLAVGMLVLLIGAAILYFNRRRMNQ